MDGYSKYKDKAQDEIVYQFLFIIKLKKALITEKPSNTKALKSTLTQIFASHG